MSFSKSQSISILKNVKEKLGIDSIVETNPEIIKDVLKELSLDGFYSEFDVVDNLIEEAKNNPVNIKLFLDNTEIAIIEKHPALIEFLQYCLENNLLKKSEYVLRSIHIAYILEILTVSFANNIEFGKKLHEYFFRLRREAGINVNNSIRSFCKVWKITGSFFASLKLLSVDPGIRCFLLNHDSKVKFTKEYLRLIYKKKEISYVEYRFLLTTLNPKNGNKGLVLNIFEAGVAEFKNNFKNNAFCAYILNQELNSFPKKDDFTKSTILPENQSDKFYSSFNNSNNIFSTTELNSEWASLYGSWNLAFILSELDDLHILFPKLLIPSVIDSKPENYIQLRIIALWICMNSILMKKINKKSELITSKKMKKLSEVLGKINKKYSLNFAKNKDFKIKDSHIHRYFSNFFINSIRIIVKKY